MATKAKNIDLADVYAPPVPATTASIRNPLESLTVYEDGTIVLPRQLTHDNNSREVKLLNLAKELKPDFEGVETEDNWGRRETNIIVLRKLTYSTVPTERTTVYVSIFRSLLDGILKSATSLRTSLSLHGTTLIQEAAKTVGPALDHAFDFLYPSLEKQCLTKPAQAQAANNAMIALITELSFHSRIMDSISSAMDSKNKALRGYVIGWLDAILQCRSKSTLEAHVDVIEKVLRKALADADGTVREKSRLVFWTFSSKFKQRGDIMYESLPKQTQKSLDASNGSGVLSSKAFDSSLNRGPQPPRPATSHADRSSLKQFIKDKKKEAKKVEAPRPLVERPKSAAPGHERNQPDSSSSLGVKKSTRGPEPSSRPESAASTATIDRRHIKQQSQDLKKAPRKHAENGYVDDHSALGDQTRNTTMTPHAAKRAVRRPLERPDSAVDRPKSSGSTASSVAPSKAVRPTTKPAVPTRPRTVASVASVSNLNTGTLSSAPKRPNFNRKAPASSNTPSMQSSITIPIDSASQFHHDTVPAHIAHVVTPPRVMQEPMPLQVLSNPPYSNSNKEVEIPTKTDVKDAEKNLPEFSHGTSIDPRSISAGTLNVMASIISERSNEIPKDAFDMLSTSIEHKDVHVRRAAMDLALALWSRLDDPMVFWSQLEGLQKKSRDFLMYWVNRRKVST